mgnify:CR=1 FL=1
MLTGAATSHSLGAVTTSARSYGREVQTQHWRITLDELRENFRLPEKEVAKKLGALSCLRLVDPQSLSCFHRSLSLDSFRRFRDHRHQSSSSHKLR